MSAINFSRTGYAHALFSMLLFNTEATSDLISFGRATFHCALFTASHILAPTSSSAFTTLSAELDKSVRSHLIFPVLTKS